MTDIEVITVTGRRPTRDELDSYPAPNPDARVDLPAPRGSKMFDRVVLFAACLAFGLVAFALGVAFVRAAADVPSPAPATHAQGQALR